MTAIPTPEELASMREKYLHFSGFSTPDVLALLDAIEAMAAENGNLRAALVDVINRGTDGWCTPDVSTEFLCLAPDEVAAVKCQRDDAREAIRYLHDRIISLGGTVPRLDVAEACIRAGCDITAHRWYADYRRRTEGKE